MTAVNLSIAKAFEKKLAELTPPMTIVTENNNSSPALPYEQVFFLFNTPDNPTMGDGHYRQRGYMQVKLVYSSNIGKGAAYERGGLIQNFFPRGLPVTADGVIATVEKTPEVTGGKNDSGNYVVNVFVYFYADIFGV